MPRLQSKNVLVGFDTSDDAGVYRLDATRALVQTVDFFTPIVDDPYTFGAIAAANSLSDVYAMGGTPLTALSVLCWPASGDNADLEAILCGGGDKMIEAGCVVLGGHSVKDDEIKFGYAVTGLVDPGQVWANRSAQPGDLLSLTKPLGTGVISTALKRDLAHEAHVQTAIASMLRLNRPPAGAVVHGCTDVTGFGLLGHAREMALASDVTIEIDAEALPLLDGALDYARQGAIPGGAKNNRDFVEGCVAYAGVLDPALDALLYDPQTSGGLLIAGPLAYGPVVGRVLPRSGHPLRVR